MKTWILLAACVVFPLFTMAQQQYKYPRYPALLETYRDKFGKLHTRRRVTAVPEHHTVTRWHYHTTYRRVSDVKGPGRP
jgi:hypothetical protein